MALNYGLYSPNLAVKRAALEAFIETQPVLNIYMEQAEGEKNEHWSLYASKGDGSILEDARFFYNYKIGKFDEEQSCYLYSKSNSYCMLRISDEQIGYSFWEKWHALKLNDQGQLIGSGAFPSSKKNRDNNNSDWTRIMTKKTISAILFSLLASTASAQSLSVADLQAQIDAELSKGEEYAVLLNDPDPARAVKAMELMLDSGDEVLVKAALDYGIFSPDKNVRNLAIKAYLDTSPRLEVQFDGKRADRDDLISIMAKLYALAPNEEGFMTTSFDIKGYNNDDNCYFSQLKVSYSTCLLRIIGETIQYRSSDGKWYEMAFLDSGELTTQSTQAYNSSAEVTVTIPLR